MTPTGRTTESLHANDVNELKQYADIHARNQRITRYQAVLDRIWTDGEGPGSWAHEWCAAAERCARRGRRLDAARRYIMARFPYVNGAARQEAMERARAAFSRWRDEKAPEITPLVIDAPGGTMRMWQCGLSTREPLPLVIVMGGIVTVKEQWAPSLSLLRRLGFAALAVDMPGVGENTTPYTAGSWQMLPAVMDAVADRADVSRTYAFTFSFSGHMALRCAIEDLRIRGVITSGAPISGFFTDAGWRSQIPRVTVDTLAHMTGGNAASVLEPMRGWALSPHDLAALGIPVRYSASLRDEIIPYSDIRTLRSHVRDLRVLEHDDVHGAPRHVAQTQLWMVRELLRMRHPGDPRQVPLELLRRAAVLRSRLP